MDFDEPDLIGREGFQYSECYGRDNGSEGFVVSHIFEHVNLQDFNIDRRLAHIRAVKLKYEFDLTSPSMVTLA